MEPLRTLELAEDEEPTSRELAVDFQWPASRTHLRCSGAIVQHLIN